MSFLASAKTVLTNFFWASTSELILCFNSPNSCLSPVGVGPEMINGVRASSISTESTSSTMA